MVRDDRSKTPLTTPDHTTYSKPMPGYGACAPPLKPAALVQAWPERYKPCGFQGMMGKVDAEKEFTMFLHSRQIIIGIAFAVILNPSPGGSLLAETDPLEILFPYEWVGHIDKVKFNEPSGIVFHTARGTLFVVGDNGDMCEIQKDGTLVKQKHIRRADFEGITYDPSTGLLYAAIEGEEKIVEFDPDSFAEMRKFSIGRIFQDQALLKAGEGGIEGITFVPKPGHPHGGTFYVANQSFDLTRAEDISAIFDIHTYPGLRPACPVALQG